MEPEQRTPPSSSWILRLIRRALPPAVPQPEDRESIWSIRRRFHPGRHGRIWPGRRGNCYTGIAPDPSAHSLGRDSNVALSSNGQPLRNPGHPATRGPGPRRRARPDGRNGTAAVWTPRPTASRSTNLRRAITRLHPASLGYNRRQFARVPTTALHSHSKSRSITDGRIQRDSV